MLNIVVSAWLTLHNMHEDISVVQYNPFCAIADEVDSFVRTQTHVHPLFVDGRDNAEWIVLDYGNIFVHIMQREPRAYYDIEHLWADGKITEIPEV